VTAAAVAGAAAHAARAAKGPAIASNAKEGGLRAALFPGGRKLLVEAAVIAVLIAIGAIVAVKLNVHPLHNPRPLGGANIDVTPAPGSQNEASIAIDPHGTIFGVDDGLAVHASADGGRTWTSAEFSALSAPCTHRDPRIAIDRNGRQYVAFVVSSLCEDELVPHVAVATRAAPGEPWHVVRVAKPAWEYGYDDAPAIAVAPSGRVYVAYTRSLGETAEAVVVSSSGDHGATWTKPRVVAPAASHPHLAQLAVAADGSVYVAGIDNPHGLWLARSTDGGSSFTKPEQLAPLRANPDAGDCSRTGTTPVAQEARTCAGPNLSLVALKSKVYAMWSDAAANGTQDVYLHSVDPAFTVTVSPPDHGKAQQLLPVVAADPVAGLLWACWYDTTYSPGSKQAWFTCSHSRDARRWSAPVRAAAVPSRLEWLYAAYAHVALQPALVAHGGIAHPFWIDGRRTRNLNDVFTARLRAN
jgi:hypothetical protein